MKVLSQKQLILYCVNIYHTAPTPLSRKYKNKTSFALSALTHIPLNVFFVESISAYNVKSQPTGQKQAYYEEKQSCFFFALRYKMSQIAE